MNDQPPLEAPPELTTIRLNDWELRSLRSQVASRITCYKGIHGNLVLTDRETRKLERWKALLSKLEGPSDEQT